MSRIVVVAAHPDDEALWFGSVLRRAEKIVLCYGAPFARPDMAARRARAVAALAQALPGLEFLAIPEFGPRRLVDWSAPELTATGMAISEPAAQARYDANHATLLAALRPILGRAEEVYTHNGWGEYGHPEHVQVHRAVAELQASLGFALGFSNYVGPASLGLAGRIGATSCWAERRAAAPDARLCRELRAIYLEHGAWTYPRWHRWPREEHFYIRPAGAVSAWQSLAGERLLDVSSLRWWRRPIYRRIQRNIGSNGTV